MNRSQQAKSVKLKNRRQKDNEVTSRERKRN